MIDIDHYSFRITWSAEDGEFVATCAEFPSLSWLAESQVEALAGLRGLVADTVTDMMSTGETVPVPLADRPYSGRLHVRLSPDLHRRLAIEAAEARVSLNRLVTAKLSA
ncbi:MAG: hypothetical protein RLY86_2982 [Pseudomonadota bacterium]|jgi:predicted HicB family RNase H-like nuclease